MISRSFDSHVKQQEDVRLRSRATIGPSFAAVVNPLRSDGAGNAGCQPAPTRRVSCLVNEHLPPGPQACTISPSAPSPHVARAPRVRRIPLPTTVTIATRPSERRRDADFVRLILGSEKAKYFCARGWTGCVGLIALRNLDFPRTGFWAVICPLSARRFTSPACGGGQIASKMRSGWGLSPPEECGRLTIKQPR